MPSTLADWLSHLESLHLKSIALGLERVERVKQRLNHQADVPEAEVEFSDVNVALNYLFSSFESRHRFHTGKLDREYRRPDVLVELIGKLNVLPCPSRTCLVSGSKGKGTVSRMIAWNLSLTGLRVGLVLTPEEVSHLDRIRIGNECIPESDFCKILGAMRPLLDNVLDEQPEDYYFAPTAIFLLVALVWFQEQGVDAWVIEGGRGVKFDEIGQIDAEVGIVTNVLPEHMGRLGASIEDIAEDKLSLANRCRSLVAGASVLRWKHVAPNQFSQLQSVALSDNELDTTLRPRWHDELDAIARAASEHIFPGLLWHHFDTPAFFFAHGGISEGKVTRGTVCCDAAIHPDCLDTEFLKNAGLTQGAALIGLSSDKDGEGIASKLAASGFQHIYTVSLTSRVGHIHAWKPTSSAIKQVAEMDVSANVGDNVRDMAIKLAHQHGSLYVVGIQMFIRSMRQALSVGRLEPEGQWRF